MPSTEQRRFPLHVHISAMFTFLLLLTGIMLGLFNYRQNSDLILSSSEQLFTRIEEEVRLDLQHTYQPIRHLLSLLATSDNTGAADLRQRLALLRPFSQALTDNPNLASLYTGYSDGDFFMVRPLRTALSQAAFQAPSNAAFQVWSIERETDGSMHSRSLLFDRDLNQIAARDITDERYDPRNRPWFNQASTELDQITTAPYVFFSTRDVGTTLARRASSTVVLGADLTLADLSATLARHRVTPGTQVVLFDEANNAVAYPESDKLIIETGTAHLIKAQDLHPVIKQWLEQGSATNRRLEADGREWVISRSHMAEGGPRGLELALLVPEDELLADAYQLRWRGALLTLGILLLCLPLGWLISRILVRPLRSLVQEADAIRSFNFNYPLTRRSPVLEVDQLTVSMQRMKQTLASFFEITASLSAETRFAPLLQRILQETVSISQAQAGLIYLLDSSNGQMEPNRLIINGVLHDPKSLGIESHSPDEAHTPAWLKLLNRERDSLVAAVGFDQAGDLREILHELESPRVHLVGIRLHNRSNETVGVLVLLHQDTGASTDLDKLRHDRIAFIQAVSGAAAACIESHRMQARQQQLLDSFIQIIAGAIDAKSPYTGGHCQRVPALTLMLARAAADSQAPEFSQYQPTDEEWEALHIAAWLHDCGKVTTPEYVVDKATKLETLYDRIHEVRTRFEVLKRDVWVDYWQALAQGAEEPSQAIARDTRLASLDDDFAFIAQSNLGGEYMDEGSQQRLRQIAGRTWLRTLDDRVGVSWEENLRQARTPPSPLPTLEPLLADKPEHLFERPASEQIADDNPWGFKLDVPLYKFNRGELYNLSVGRGTLTEEERYLINHHMVQTILMLSQLPFPSHLQSVPEIAGGHHEKMDGTGYPKRLKREDMSLPARMMAIADIFEALTATDRPYKKGKTLSEALSIMASMCRDAHIDPQLFQLFVESEIALQYGRIYLDSQQIDEIDVAALLDKAGLGARKEAASGGAVT
ncbi:HAMP domain-containing protein [Pseudomonas sp. LS1212]|uniref:HD domain-containing phosphohydrolase n=1 Tax=Pseudomonas sp. LS1212 TaxID=2972478 RepID=UPI00215C6240|nr:HD domain-containing phosphohydrolase [Pseudomonas sp. LS1212]UVJ42607.1 HAMP domain-containing protein [Pseudomonas sp. LS1212]